MGVAIGVESDEVVADEFFEKLSCPREDGEDLRGGERRMEEEANLALPSHSTQFRTQRNQVIVLHPDGVAASKEGVEALGETTIDASISAIGVMAKVDEIGEGVQERPESAVGKDGVEEIDLVCGEVHRANVDATAARDGRLSGKAAFRCCAAPSEPHAAVLFQGRLDGRDKSADSLRSLVLRRVRKGGCGQSVGHDDKTLYFLHRPAP